MPGTKKRVPLFGEEGRRIRGKENKEATELAPAKEKLSWEKEATGTPFGNGEWLVCWPSDSLQPFRVESAEANRAFGSTWTWPTTPGKRICPSLSIAKEITVASSLFAPRTKRLVRGANHDSY